jgi:hypothetical protein
LIVLIDSLQPGLPDDLSKAFLGITGIDFVKVPGVRY